jgi:hypothetical protein
MRKRRLGQVQGCSHTNPELSLGALASNLYKIQCWLPEKVEDLLGSASNHTNHDFTILRWMMQRQVVYGLCGTGVVPGAREMKLNRPGHCGPCGRALWLEGLVLILMAEADTGPNFLKGNPNSS